MRSTPRDGKTPEPPRTGATLAESQKHHINSSEVTRITPRRKPNNPSRISNSLGLALPPELWQSIRWQAATEKGER
jgi:hypothetical protein